MTTEELRETFQSAKALVDALTLAEKDVNSAISRISRCSDLLDPDELADYLGPLLQAKDLLRGRRP